MKTAISLTVLALCLMIGLPGAARASSGSTGACLFDQVKPGNSVPPLGLGEGISLFSFCIDSLSDAECAALCLPDGDNPDGGFGAGCEFLPGQTCAGTGIPWDGACDGVDSPIGALCLLLASSNPGDSQLLCEGKGAGTWLGNGSVCGGVPALPKLAYGALALVLLAGTLTILTLQSKS
jgi:hypothetical protein